MSAYDGEWETINSVRYGVCDSMGRILTGGFMTQDEAEDHIQKIPHWKGEPTSIRAFRTQSKRVWIA